MSAPLLYEAGFRELVCVTPPGAPLSPQSRIAPGQQGKAPGRQNSSGLWAGYPWAGKAPTREEALRWEEWGANVGIQASHYPGIDLDVEDPELTNLLIDHVQAVLGDTILRIGRPPHALLMYRVSRPGAFRRQRIRFSYGGGDHLVEVLGAGQQYVIEGQHPAGMPFYTDPPLHTLSPSQVPQVTPERLLEALEGMSSYLISLGASILAHEGDKDRGAVPDQTHLKAPVELVREAVGMLPNTREAFPFWEDYLRLGYAIHGATQDEPGAGFDIWWSWCVRWEVRDADLEVTRADWLRMKPPWRLGAGYIFALARAYGFNDAALDFPDEQVELEGPDSGPVAYSDAAMANRFISRYRGEVKSVPQTGGWVVWDGARWKLDDGKRVENLAAYLLAEASGEASNTILTPGKADKVAVRLASTAMRNAVVSYAAASRTLVKSLDEFDADPWTINTPAGLMDLRSGELTPNQRELVTKVTGVAPALGHPTRWLKFLEESTLGDFSLLEYLHRLCGYALTGSIDEHALVFLYGGGGNGKGVFLSTISGVMGSYASVAAMDTFTASRGDRHPTDLAMLRGARLVTSQETQEGRAWDDARVKALTGGDPISARFMRQDFFTFHPTFKLLFAGNHKPRIGSLDDAWRRRFHLIPFIHHPPEVNRFLAEELQEEWGKILHWSIEGCVSWQEEGLAPPDTILDFTREYFADQDPVGRWLEQTCETGPSLFSLSHDLFDSWREWCASVGERPMPERKLSQSLMERGFERGISQDSGRRKGFYGIKALAVEERPPFLLVQGGA